MADVRVRLYTLQSPTDGAHRDVLMVLAKRCGPHGDAVLATDTWLLDKPSPTAWKPPRLAH